MQVLIDIPDAQIGDYQDLFYKIHGMAASEGLFDDKVKSQRALALKVVLDILDSILNGTPLPKGHGRLIDADAVLVEPLGNTYKDIDTAETIIEADRREEE